MRIHRHPLLLSLLAGWLCPVALPETHAFTTNLVPVADTSIRSSVPDNNLGGDPALPVGRGTLGSPTNRCLLRFDLGELPPDAVITAVTLRLVIVANSAISADFSLHRVQQEWSEGSKTSTLGTHDGAPASPGEATWNSRLHAVAPWDSPGGQAGSDYASIASAAATLLGVTNEFSSAGLLADVQLWKNDPGTNYGWILIATGEPSATGKRIASREDTTNAPVLIVEYTLPSGPASPVLFDAGVSGNEFRFSFAAESNRTYTVEYRDSFTGGDWTGLTQFPAQSVETTLHLTNTVSSAERYFRVRTP